MSIIRGGIINSLRGTALVTPAGALDENALVTHQVFAKEYSLWVRIRNDGAGDLRVFHTKKKILNIAPAAYSASAYFTVPAAAGANVFEGPFEFF